MRCFGGFVALAVLLATVSGKSTNCKCGWTNPPKARIMGGRDTGINEYPMIVGLKGPGDYGPFCGGVILTKRHILTAAHCVVDNNYGPMVVIIGEHDISTNKETTATQEINVKEPFVHKEYNHTGVEERDIALLYLEKDIKFTQFVGPACMPSEKEQLVREKVKVFGWGLTKTNGQHSKTLREVDLEVRPLSFCAPAFPGSIPLSKGKTCHYCTFTPDKDSCQGDSGGPVMWYDDEIKSYTTVGVISFGGDCGESPGINTEVFYYNKWIQDHIKATDSSATTCQKS